jgi:hypothetical protein
MWRLPIVAHSFLSHGGNKHHKHHNLVVECITILSHLHITPIPSVSLIMPSVSTNFTRTTHFIPLAHYTYSNRITKYTICTPLLYHLYPHYHTHHTHLNPKCLSLHILSYPFRIPIAMEQLLKLFNRFYQAVQAPQRHHSV